MSGSNEDNFVIDTDGLVIKNVTEADDGIYICRAIVLDTGELSERNIKVEVGDGINSTNNSNNNDNTCVYIVHPGRYFKSYTVFRYYLCWMELAEILTFIYNCFRVTVY